MYRDLSITIISKSLTDRFYPKVWARAEDDCWEWQAGRTPIVQGKTGVHGGYGQFTIYDLDLQKYRSEYAHRVAWVIANNANIPARMLVMHSCDNPPCCNPKHLVLATFSRNSQDRENKGRGGRHLESQERFLQNPEIAEMYKQGWTINELESEFLIPRKTIHTWLKKQGVPLRKRGTPGFRSSG